MIRSREALLAALRCGETVARLTQFEGAHPEPRWALAGNGETVVPTAVRAADHHGELAVIQRDLLGEPMQYGAAP